MSYTVIARKWRPQTFAELIGQEHVAKTLQNAISSSRIAHGYIFTGSRGVGKTSAARIFAKALNCANPVNGEPCNVCASCQEISSGRSMDIIEIDGASNNSVDNIRDLRDNVRFAPASGTYKIYIVDEVHMLSKGAFNALLKTLEEPPPHAIFIFATTEIHKVLPTILSRCQRFDFKRIPVQKMIDRLAYICREENISITDDALLQVAKKADGGMRDSQSILDQLISFCGNNITLADVNASLGFIDSDIFFAMVDSFISKNVGAVFTAVESIFQRGLDLLEVVYGLEDHLRHLLVCISLGNTELIDTIDSDKNRYMVQAKEFTETDILRMVDVLHKAEYSIKTGQNPKLKLELALSKICNMDQSVHLRQLLAGAEKKKPNLVVSAETEAKPQAPAAVAAPSQPVRAETPAPIQKEAENIPPAPPISVKPPQETPVSAPTPAPPQPQFVQPPVPPEPPKQMPPPPPAQSGAPLAAKPPQPQAVPSGNDPLKAAWLKLTEQFKLTKPALYNCLFQSRYKGATEREITVIFDDSNNGRLSANMVRNSKEFIEQSFQALSNTAHQIKIEFANFNSLGIKIEYQDTESVIKRYREANSSFNHLVETFDLKPASRKN